MDVIEELKFLGKLTKKRGVGGGFGRGRGCRDCEGVRMDVNEELKFL